MPIQKNNNYWLNREKQLLIKAIEEEDKLEILLKKAYKKAKNEIEKEIASLFIKYAKDNKLTYAEASKMLTGMLKLVRCLQEKNLENGKWT